MLSDARRRREPGMLCLLSTPDVGRMPREAIEVEATMGAGDPSREAARRVHRVGHDLDGAPARGGLNDDDVGIDAEIDDCGDADDCVRGLFSE